MMKSVQAKLTLPIVLVPAMVATVLSLVVLLSLFADVAQSSQRDNLLDPLQSPFLELCKALTQNPAERANVENVLPNDPISTHALGVVQPADTPTTAPTATRVPTNPPPTKTLSPTAAPVPTEAFTPTQKPPMNLPQPTVSKSGAGNANDNSGDDLENSAPDRDDSNDDDNSGSDGDDLEDDDDNSGPGSDDWGEADDSGKDGKDK